MGDWIIGFSIGWILVSLAVVNYKLGKIYKLLNK